MPLKVTSRLLLPLASGYFSWSPRILHVMFKVETIRNAVSELEHIKHVGDEHIPAPASQFRALAAKCRLDRTELDNF